MELGIANLHIEMDPAGRDSERQLSSFCERLGKKFRVPCRWRAGEEPSTAVLVVVSLEKDQHAVTGKFDAIMEFCERSGFARVLSNDVWVDDLDFVLSDRDEH